MSKKNDPNYIDAREFPEEKLNPNRPHEYRKKYGVSPVGQIGEINRRRREEDPEGFAKMASERTRKRNQTVSMSTRRR